MFLHTAMEAGPHTYVLKAYDRAGNQTSSPSLPVTAVDTTPPLVVVSAPVPGAVSSETIEAFGTVGDISGVLRLQWRVDRGPWYDTSPSANWAFQAPAESGVHILELRAEDFPGNVSVPQQVVFYLRNAASPAAVFDEELRFIFGTPAFWTEDFVQGEGGAGLANFALRAYGMGSRASILREKIVPARAVAVECSCLFFNRAGMTWTDSSGTLWLARVRDGQIQCGPAAAPLTSMAPPGASRLRCEWRNGSITLRASAEEGAPVSLICPAPGLSLTDLRGMSWEVTGDIGVSALEEANIRAIYPENDYRVVSFGHYFRNAWKVQWGSWPGRRYTVQTSQDLQSWAPAGAIAASGILSDMLVYPDPGGLPFYVRVREQP